MPIDRPESRRATAPLAHRAGPSASAAEVAAAINVIGQEINDTLLPIIGNGGVMALHSRSIHLASTRYSWMASLRNNKPSGFGGEALSALLAQQEASLALAAGEDFLQIFHDLLVSLIGRSLTERLLRAVWPSNSSGSSAQDISQ